MRNKEIIDLLTIDEKIRLLNGDGSWFTNNCNGKLPTIMMSDGPHGLRKQEVENYADLNNSEIATCYPTASAIASSWDINVASKLAEAIADEALKEKVSIVLGCGINIKRNPLCGRNFEYFSEDPYLTGELATAYIKAMESKGVGTSLKHFACNNQEKRRQTQNSKIDERALHEIYLKAFETVVKNAQPTTIMSSYNRLNGEYVGRNKGLLTDLLREKWGFKGLIVSDWGAALDIVACIKAGMDIEMPDSFGQHTLELKTAYDNGEITLQEIDRAVENVVAMVVNQSKKIIDSKVDYDVQHNIAKELECQSAVLLKNVEKILPVDKNKKILVIGNMATEMRFQGGGSSHITTVKTKNALESLTEIYENIDYAKGYLEDSTNSKLQGEAVEKAKTADVVLFFGGLSDKYEGEGYDRATLSIPPCQTELLDKVSEVNDNIVFVSFGGSPIEMKFINNVKGILQMYLGGQGVGEACGLLISGARNPSGKLAETYPININDVPSTKTFGKETANVEYRESIFVGYRYFDTFKIPTLFDFGFGLSYTNFEYTNLVLSTNTYKNGNLEVMFDVANTGEVNGAEVAEVYIKNPEGKYMRASRELAGFVKIKLDSKEKKTTTVTVNERSFSIYNEEKADFQIASGTYQIMVGSSLSDIRLEATVEVLGEEITLDQTMEFSEYFNSELKITSEKFNSLLKNKNQRNFDKIPRGGYTKYNSMNELAKASLLVKIVKFVLKKVVYGMNKDKLKTDPAVTMIVTGMQEGPLDSVLTASEGAVPYFLAEAMVLSANKKHMKAIGKLIKRK